MGNWNSNDWLGRTIIVGQMIPKGASVIDFGSYDRSLAKYVTGTYFAVDKEGGPGVIKCDFDSPLLPEFPLCDVGVIAGVLEYLRYPRSFCQHAKKFADTFIVTARFRGEGRKFAPWLIRQMFFDFDLARMENWRRHKIYKFERRRYERSEDRGL